MNNVYKSVPIHVFVSYASQNEKHRLKLERHLSNLKNQQIIETWTFRKIMAGSEWEEEIHKNLSQSNLILLLISPDFMASRYCNDVEMKVALERHKNRQALVILIYLIPCEFEGAPFEMLQRLPVSSKAITEWPNEDKVWMEVAKGIRQAIEDFFFRFPNLEKTENQAIYKMPPDKSNRRINPKPKYGNARIQELGEQLEQLRIQKENHIIRGKDTTKLDILISELKRDIRQGPQLYPGEYLYGLRYRLIERIGEGGFGTVWKAYDVKQ